MFHSTTINAVASTLQDLLIKRTLQLDNTYFQESESKINTCEKLWVSRFTSSFLQFMQGAFATCIVMYWEPDSN